MMRGKRQREKEREQLKRADLIMEDVGLEREKKIHYEYEIEMNQRNSNKRSVCIGIQNRNKKCGREQKIRITSLFCLLLIQMVSDWHLFTHVPIRIKARYDDFSGV
jgi:hypothetical protein